MGGRGGAGGGIGAVESGRGRGMSLAKFLENQRKQNISGMLLELQKQSMEIF
jgi:hypothetical protein